MRQRTISWWGVRPSKARNRRSRLRRDVGSSFLSVAQASRLWLERIETQAGRPCYGGRTAATREKVQLRRMMRLRCLRQARSRSIAGGVACGPQISAGATHQRTPILNPGQSHLPFVVQASSLPASPKQAGSLPHNCDPRDYVAHAIVLTLTAVTKRSKDFRKVISPAVYESQLVALAKYGNRQRPSLNRKKFCRAEYFCRNVVNVGNLMGQREIGVRQSVVLRLCLSKGFLAIRLRPADRFTIDSHSKSEDDGKFEATDRFEEGATQSRWTYASR
jgi:hypothetical protein